MTTLAKLQEWYICQCDEDWEHSYGVRIETLDNPGWLLTIDLTGTALKDRAFPIYSYGTDETADTSGADWVDCRISENKFQAAGGPAQLEEMINIFLTWAGS